MDSSGIKLRLEQVYQAAGGLHVNVCGQELKVSCENGTPSLQDLKDTVQRGIGLQQDCFIFFDANGHKLHTDKEVLASIQAGVTPIYATLSGHALHDFEQRQEEFAQMQWKVVRDQFTVLSLQLQDFQRQFKALRTDVDSKVKDDGSIEEFRRQLAAALQDVADCKESRVTVEELVRVASENVQSMSQNLGKEILVRDTALQEIDFKIKRVSEVQANEITGLTERMNEKHRELLEAHELLGRDMYSLRQELVKCHDLQTAHHEQHVDMMSAMEGRWADALSQATNAWSREARQDASVQMEDVANQLAEIGKRLDLNDSLTSQVSGKCRMLTEQLNEQMNGMREAIEQCRLQSRAASTASKEAQQKQDRSAKEIMSEIVGLKQDASRERKAREEQVKSTQKNINGSIKTAFADLETRVCDRVEKESTVRSHNMLQVLDDIGAALEKDIPSSLRSESLEKQNTNSIRSSAPLTTPSPVAVSTFASGQDVGKRTLGRSASSGAMVQFGVPVASVNQKQFVPNARPVPTFGLGLPVSPWTQLPTQAVHRERSLPR